MGLTSALIFGQLGALMIVKFHCFLLIYSWWSALCVCVQIHAGNRSKQQFEKRKLSCQRNSCRSTPNPTLWASNFRPRPVGNQFRLIEHKPRNSEPLAVNCYVRSNYIGRLEANLCWMMWDQNKESVACSIQVNLLASIIGLLVQQYVCVHRVSGKVKRNYRITSDWTKSGTKQFCVGIT